MAENIKALWLVDHEQIKIAPKTVSTQILNEDGTLFKETVENAIANVETEIATHASNGDIHVTAEEKEAWSNIEIPSLDGYATEEYVENLYTKLNSNTVLGFYCIEDVTIVINGISKTYPANSNVEISFIEGDTFEIIPTSNNSILTLNAFPGVLDTFYPWLEGVRQFSNILFDMNTEDMYTKWSQGNQGSYQVQFAQYVNCIFWSDNPYISDVSKRTNYTLCSTSQLPLCYSSIPENTFKSFYLAFGVNSDPNWSNPAYKDSFAQATWATQAFSYYGARIVGYPGHDSSSFNITLPKDCRGLMFDARNIECAGTFDAVNCTNFGAKSGSWREAFGDCISLRRLYIKNLKVNLNISWSPVDYDSIYYIISAAANTSKITISVSPYTYNLLSQDDFDLAASKNITIALITTNYVEDKRLSAINNKADAEHNHDDLYYTEAEIDDRISSLNNAINNIDLSAYETKTDATTKFDEAKEYTDNALASANDYTDEKVANLLDNSTEAVDSIMELATAMKENEDVVSALESAVGNKVDKVTGKGLSTNDLTDTLKSNYDSAYSHVSNNTNPHGVTASQVGAYTKSEIDAKVDSLQSAINGKAASSHTHAISDVTNLQSSLDAKVPTSRTINGKALTSNVVLSASDVGAAESGHTHSSYVNQNAFSNVKVGDTTIAADTTTDTLTLVAGDNITLTPDATGDKITIAATNTTYSLSSFGITATAAELNKMDGVTATTAELNYVAGVTSNIQTQLDGKAASSHAHVISDITNLQSALDGKAPSEHGTHVSYSTTAPVMDGTASVGSDSTVARSDHKHPTDTSRASKTEFDSHTSDTTAHMTSTQKSQLTTAYNHSQAAHAPSNAEKNQNAFSNIKVGSTTVAADTTTDTVEFVGSNVTITPDATNDKVTFAVADGSTNAKGIVQLTDSTSSTSTTTAATPNSVKSAYDLANTAKTNAATAQTRADNAYSLAEGKVDSLSDLGITATATELNYCDGVASNIQVQLDNKVSISDLGSFELITVADIDTICGATIFMASEVTF